ncbi:diguanylate cyclase [Duganella sp. LX20W]|uniref:diguanylate cyclase n=1 Tax=Rugamonas brunnea TaxID=2758569 RepID=A0A7W2EXA5_9BURK|nr:diguanylate cyclase [Rugamonas brunnea]MBA5640306.1 diguanylate cyclase [Rugamonas brunnea]
MPLRPERPTPSLPQRRLAAQRAAHGRPVLLALLAWLTALTLLLALPSAQAGVPALRFQKLGPLGNDEPTMLTLLQDRQGYVWVGTLSNGLYRYNGYQAVKYAHQPGDSHSLPHNRVSALYEDGQGRIWAGTQDGLARYNPERNDFTVYAPASGPHNHRIIKAIISDGGHGMWLASWGGLQHFDPATGAFTVYSHDPARPDSLASNDLNALALDPIGGVWAATWPGGLDYLAPGATGFVHRQADPAPQAEARRNIVRALQFDPSGALWIGTEAGVLRWDGRGPWQARTVVAAPASRVTSFYLDRQRTLWATTLSAGLLRWNGAAGQFERFHHAPDDPYSLPSDNLKAVMQDRGGMLWVASYTDGISLANLSSAGLARYVPLPPAGESANASDAMLSMARAPGGRLWLGSDTGLSLYDPGSNRVLRNYRAQPGKRGTLSQDIIYSLYQDQRNDGHGPLWLGTSDGLNRLDRPDGPFRVIHFGNPASDYINAIAPGAGGVLWLATGNSLIRYDPASDARRVYRHDPQDAHSRSVDGTSAVLEDERGQVWAGSEWNGGGLDVLDPASGQFHHYTHRDGDPHSLADDNVASLHRDRQGRIWVGTGRGLHLAQPQPDGGLHFRYYGAALGGEKVLAIRDDAHGRIWCSTLTGLYRLDPATGQASHYTATDGLTEGFIINSAVAGDDGDLYFGSVHGLTAVSPDAVRSTSVAPQVAISDITIFNHSIYDGKLGPGVTVTGPLTAPTALTLSSQASVFSLEFAALHYADPAANRYAYQLQGFDRDWVETDAAHRSATYTNLNPGTYVFRVRAANHRGVWSPEPATLLVTIEPPLWQTWWFRALAGVLVAAALLGAHRWRIARLTRHQRQLEQLVTARTAELEESNRKLAALSTTDGLTGVRNRRGFDEALAAEWRRAARTGQSLALSMLDVDHFKKYNDHYGHLAGDACLQKVATLITAHGRRTSDLVARYGGEEFALLAAATDATDAFGIAEAICAELARLRLPHDGSPFGTVTISVGVAVMVPTEGTTPDMLVRMADRALYRAKEKGRNMALLALPTDEQ